MDKPDLVVMAEEIMERHQSGDDNALYKLVCGAMNAIIDEYDAMLSDNDDRTITYMAPQVASLLTRIGWLRNKTS